MKLCKKCNIDKDFSEFSKSKNSKDGLNLWCKLCNKEYLKNYYIEKKELHSIRSKQYYKLNSKKIKDVSKKWRENNLEYIKEYHKDYYSNNKELISEYKKEHYINNKNKYLDKSIRWKKNNRESYLYFLKKWKSDNKDYNKEYLKKWFMENPTKKKEYYDRLRINSPHIIAWRKVLHNVIKRINTKKTNTTIEMLGYSADEFKKHIESLFLEGMSWDNWGEWHIDHKIPVSKFNKQTPMSVVNSLDNLQPLWALDNLKKSNKVEND